MLVEIALGAIGSIVAKSLLGDFAGTVASEVTGEALRRALRSPTIATESACVGAPRLLTATTVVSHTPGRIRCTVVGLRGDATLAVTMTDELLNLGGINSVRANSATGTILIHFDAETHTQATVIAGVDQARARSIRPIARPRARLAPVA
jgi:hypothetical protein